KPGQLGAWNKTCMYTYSRWGGEGVRRIVRLSVSSNGTLEVATNENAAWVDHPDVDRLPRRDARRVAAVAGADPGRTHAVPGDLVARVPRARRRPVHPVTPLLRLP